jgi:hypothetical protein
MEQPVIMVHSHPSDERAAILSLIALGMNSEEIVAVTGMTEERIATSLESLCKELGVTGPIELLLLIYSVADVPASKAARNRAEHESIQHRLLRQHVEKGRLF